MALATLMLLAGAILPFMMVARWLPSTLLLSFLSYISSIGGLFLGILALGALYRGSERPSAMDAMMSAGDRYEAED